MLTIAGLTASLVVTASVALLTWAVRLLIEWLVGAGLRDDERTPE